MRNFFDEKNFIEVPTQPRLSILAACEDPETVTSFSYEGLVWPLPQTGQMWLEYELLTNPETPGFYCISTSYRNEPNPVEGRHDKIFPMIEFETHGGMNALRDFEAEVCSHLGLEKPIVLNYEDACSKYDSRTLEAEQEGYIQKDFGNSVSLENFPRRSSPFWNMKRNKNGFYNKIDVILYGMETFGSAERATDVDQMRDDFYTISDGQYANLLFNKFGRDRVNSELEAYLSLPMIPRFGGGIGATRLARALKLAGKI